MSQKIKTDVIVDGSVTASSFIGAATDPTKLPLAGGTLTGGLNVSSGEILIGTDSGDAFHPDAKLRIQQPTGTAFIQIKTANDQISGILLGDVDDDYVGGFTYSNATNALSINTNNSTKVTIDSNGDVGIGVTLPNYKLDVNGNAFVNGEFLAAPSGVVRINQYDNGLANAGEIALYSLAGTGWNVGDGLGRIRFYTADTSGIGARDVAKIEAVSEHGNGTNSTTPSGALAFYTSGHNANVVENMRLSSGGNLSVVGNVTGANLAISNWNTAYGWGDHDGLYLPIGGGTLTGALNGTDVLLSGFLKLTEGLGDGITFAYSGSNYYTIYYDGAAGQLKFRDNEDESNVIVLNSSGNIDINPVGVVNVSGTINATSFVKTDGTSSQFLKADGSVDSSVFSLSSHTHSDATTSVAGFMSAADKTKLDNSNLNVNLTVATASATAAKVTTESVTFQENTLYLVKFTLGNSVSTPTINGINIRLGTTNASTTTFSVGANTVVPMYYNATNNVMQITGSYRTGDSTEDYNLRWENSVQAGEQITRYKIIMEGIDGKFYPFTIGNSTAGTKTVSTQEFRLDGTILIYNSTTTIAADALFTNIWVSEYFTAAQYTFNQSSGFIANKSIYLVGTVNANGNFVLDNTTLTSWLTQTLPTTDDGKVYIYLGIMNNTTTAFRLEVTHPIYQYKDGAIKTYSGFAESAAKFTTARTITIGNTGKSVDGSANVSWSLSEIGALPLTGGTLTGDLTLSYAYPRINLVDTNNNSDYSIINNDGAFTIYDTTNIAYRFSINSAGNVGIGTTSIDASLPKLDVNGSIMSKGTSIIAAPTSDAIVIDYFSPSNVARVMAGSGGAWNKNIALNPYGGNVGIGTTSPAYKLHIQEPSGTTAALLIKGGKETVTSNGEINSRIDFGSNDTSVNNGNNIGGRIASVTEATNGAYTGMAFYTFQQSRTPDLKEAVRINYEGNVGIGTTTPTNYLTLGFGGTAAAPAIVIGQDSDTGWFKPADNAIGFATSGVERIRITSAGNVGINNTNPTRKLSVDGSIEAGGKTTYTKSYASLDTTGVVVAALTTSGNGTSGVFIFTCSGGDGYQRIVYSCINAAGVWTPRKDIDEGVNAFDVVASDNGATVTFTFKGRSANQAYTPRVCVEHIGSALNTTYL